MSDIFLFKSTTPYEKDNPWVAGEGDIRASFKTEQEALRFIKDELSGCYIDPITFEPKCVKVEKRFNNVFEKVTSMCSSDFVKKEDQQFCISGANKMLDELKTEFGILKSKNKIPMLRSNWREIDKAIKEECEKEDCMIPLRDRI